MNKAKLSLTITAMVLVAMIAIVSIIAVFAARTQNFTSNIKVTYTSREVQGTATARWCYGGEDMGWNDMVDSEGNTELNFELGQVDDALNPEDTIELTDPEQFIIFEYDFTNIGPRPYELTLNYQDDDTPDENVSLHTMVGPMTGSVIESWEGLNYTYKECINDAKSDIFEDFTGEINTVILPNSQTAIFIMVEVANAGADASFSGSLNFELDGTTIDSYDEEYLYYTDGESATLTGVAKGTPEDVDGINIFVSDNTELDLDSHLTYNDLPVKTIGSYAFFYQSNLTTISSFGNVETIGNCCFSDCSLSGSLIIPSSVKKIIGAFGYCYDLTITLQNGLEYIGDNAFMRCSFENFSIPGSVTSIGSCAFERCSGLGEEILISKNVTKIGNAPFANVDISSIKVDPLNLYYTSQDSKGNECNIIIEKETKTLLQGCNNSTIPQDKSIKRIGDYAFDGCRSLTGELIIPEGVISIGEFAFEYCDFSSVKISESVIYIGSCAFISNSRNLRNITIDSQTVCKNLMIWEDDYNTKTILLIYATTVKAKYEVVGLEDKGWTKQAEKEGEYFVYIKNS